MLLCGALWLFMILEARTSFWCRHRTVIAKLPGLRLRPRWGHLAGSTGGVSSSYNADHGRCRRLSLERPVVATVNYLTGPFITRAPLRRAFFVLNECVSIRINDMMALHALSAACYNGLFVVKHMPALDKSTLSSAMNLSAVSRHNGRPVWLLSNSICCGLTAFPLGATASDMPTPIAPEPYGCHDPSWTANS